MWQTLNTSPINGGSYRVFPAVAGHTYYFSFCAADGGSSTYDTQITIQNNSGGLLGIHNDDFCGFRSYLVFNCNATANYRVYVTKFYCQSQLSLGTLAYRSTYNTPLPVVYESFYGKPKGNSVLIHWTTASENNSDYFSIERMSPHSELYQPIGIVKAIGNSQQPTTYQFIDNMPAHGLNYYRLHQTDVNGVSYFSQTIDVLVGSVALPALIYYDGLNLRGSVLDTDDNVLTITVYDIFGRLLASSPVIIEEGNTTFSLPIQIHDSSMILVSVGGGNDEAMYKVPVILKQQ